ncbi:FAD-dependent monooxygenase [Paraburkholderia sp.]|uniref:FAD-dependent monooxygenase n=1 Tax=Paraburkholderia sp. TaxID=1926495 RepID=UPI003D6DA9D7
MDHPMTQPRRDAKPVIIAGAGPTGLMLAYELRRGGVDVLLVDRRADRKIDGSRAAGMQPRTVEILDQRGVAEHFLTEGSPSRLTNFGGIPLDYSRMPSRFPAINILQARTEEILDQLVTEAGAPVRWATEVTDVSQDASGVEVTVSGPNGKATLTGSYLVACDGGRSTIRKLLGVGFPGVDASMVNLLADVELDDPPRRPVRLERHEAGLVTVLQLQRGWFRLVLTVRERLAEPGSPLTFEELRTTVNKIAGTDFGMHGPRWLSSFTDANRQADQYRVGRVFLAGDAAHIHLPASGQGMSMGMQDAFNLGWKLAAVIRGEAPETLLDSYHAERHTSDGEILKLVRAQSLLCDPGDRVVELVDVMTDLVSLPEVNDRLSAMLSGLGIRYHLPGAHPLIGYRVPDADIMTDTGLRRVHELLRSARFVLLDLAGTTSTRSNATTVPFGLPPVDLGANITEWAGRVDTVRGNAMTREWRIPGRAAIVAPAAVLIRPDGHVAWACDGPADVSALRLALTQWCGPISLAAPLSGPREP